MKQIIKFDNITECTIEYGGEVFTMMWSGVNDKLVRCGGEDCMIGANPACGHITTKGELKSFDFSCKSWSIPEGGVFCLMKDDGQALAINVQTINRTNVDWTVEFEYTSVV